MKIHFRRPKETEQRVDMAAMKSSQTIKKAASVAVQLDVMLVSGKGLAACDVSRTGRRSSDPFVKFYHSNQVPEPLMPASLPLCLSSSLLRSPPSPPSPLSLPPSLPLPS